MRARTYDVSNRMKAGAVLFAKHHEVVQTLLLQRLDKPFHEGVGVR